MIIQADVIEWSRTYTGPKFHTLLQGNAINIMLPKYQKLIAVLGSTIELALVVRNVAVLNGRELIGLIEARIGMPERTVNLDQCIDRWGVEIIAIPAQPVLLLISNPHAIEDGGEFLFKSIVCFASATSRDLISGEFSMALAGPIARKLAAIGGADLLSRFWRVCAAMHTVLDADVRLAARANAKPLHTTLNCPFRDVESCGYLRLRQVIDKIQLAQQIIGQPIGTITKFLSIAVRPARNAQSIHFLADGWNANAEHCRNVFQWSLFSPV